jgi:hypothetical protein
MTGLGDLNGSRSRSIRKTLGRRENSPSTRVDGFRNLDCRGWSSASRC